MKRFFVPFVVMSALTACQLEPDDASPDETATQDPLLGAGPVALGNADAVGNALACQQGTMCMYFDIRYGGTTFRYGGGVDDDCLACPSGPGVCLNDKASSIHNFSTHLCHYYRDCGRQNFLFSLSAGQSSDWLGNQGANDQISSFICN